MRDLLFIEDLVDLYELILERIGVASGQIYNVGGGPQNQASLLEVLQLLEGLLQKDIHPAFSDWRSGDQRVCVLDISKARRELGWYPKVGVGPGVSKLADWVVANSHLFTA